MSTFKIVDSFNENELSSRWTNSKNFIGIGRTVGKNGNSITSTYKGNRYRVISKKERYFTPAERIGRGFIGVVATVFTLCIAILFKSVRNLFTKEKAKIRFAVVEPKSPSLQKTKPGGPSSESDGPSSESDRSPSQYSISKQELQSGVDISKQTITAIQACMKNVLQDKKKEGVKLYNSQPGHRVFSSDSAPEYIFKMNASSNCNPSDRDGSMRARYQRMIRAQTVCRTYALGLLVIPNAKLFTVDVEGEKYEIIAEKKLDLNPSEDVQELNFEQYASSLNETIRQLAVFICKTGYSDVEWRNNPVLNDAPDQFGCRKIGLINIEEMQSTTIGLFGDGYDRRGLVGCVDKEQGKIVEHEAKKYGVSTDSFAFSHERRKKEIENGQKLRKHYQRLGITKGTQLLDVDMNSLSLNLEEKGVLQKWDKTKEVSMKNIVEKVVKKINALILEKASKESNNSLKKKRSVLLKLNNSNFMYYNKLGLPEDNYCISKEDEKKRWLYRIIIALVEKGYLFELEKVDGYGYHIQA